MKEILNISTWTIRTLLQKGKLENIKKEMERMKLNILGLSEVRWKGAGKITSGGHEIIYSGGTESEKGVGIIVDQTVTKAIKDYWALSDRVLLVKIAGKPVDLNIIQVYAPTANSNDKNLDKFYNELDTAKTQCKSQDPLIIMSDFNAKVGTEKVDDIVGKRGLGIRNERELGHDKVISCFQTPRPGGAQTCNRRISADLRADLLSPVPRTPLKKIENKKCSQCLLEKDE
ncbi:craniofacial development protein 2-like [Plakobranchus ocellatus]|uniref:Craniofacial development protein 2-like n=1 Tax=Plakobranchus ocellatus TaxID=259542 RepID=A0AAV4CVD3_9GAST|nr:craniofacial development protein 2-like [Plakobranchus ocellatus]